MSTAAAASGRVRLLWTLIVLLGGVGVVSAVNRATVVASAIGSPPSSELAPVDRRSLDLLARILRLEPDSGRFVQIETDLRTATQKYNEQPLGTLLHVVSGALFLVFAPLQLVPGLRLRHVQLHRWSGRALLVMSLPLALSGLYLAMRSPASGPIGGSASVVFGVLFVLAGARALAAARRRDIVRHREWMLRFVAIAYGIAIIRVLDITLVAVTPIRPLRLAGPSFWVGWVVSMSAAEWWIRKTRVPSAARHRAE